MKCFGSAFLLVKKAGTFSAFWNDFCILNKKAKKSFLLFGIVPSLVLDSGSMTLIYLA